MTEDQLPWSLHFNTTIVREGGKALDLYVLRPLDQRRNPIIIAVPSLDRESPKAVELAMNDLGPLLSDPSKPWFSSFKRIFHGPWIKDELIGGRYLRITVDEEREIRALIAAEGADAAMAKAEVAQLRKDAEMMQAQIARLEQTVLRLNANGNFNLQEHITVEVPQADFFRDAIAEHPGDLFMEQPMTHQSMMLCERGGCSEG